MLTKEGINKENIPKKSVKEVEMFTWVNKMQTKPALEMYGELKTHIRNEIIYNNRPE